MPPEWFAFMGKEAGSYEPGSPFAINFRTDVKEGNFVKPLNSPVAACSDPSLACSCGDCPGASSCAEPNPPIPPEYRGCAVRIAGYQVLIQQFHLMCILHFIVLLSVTVYEYLEWDLHVPSCQVTPKLTHTCLCASLINSGMASRLLV